MLIIVILIVPRLHLRIIIVLFVSIVYLHFIVLFLRPVIPKIKRLKELYLRSSGFHWRLLKVLACGRLCDPPSHSHSHSLLAFLILPLLLRVGQAPVLLLNHHQLYERRCCFLFLRETLLLVLATACWLLQRCRVARWLLNDEAAADGLVMVV